MAENPRLLLICGFSVVLALMTAMVAIAFYALSSVGSQFNRLADYDMPRVFAIERVEKAGLRAISSSNEVVLVAGLGLEDDDDELDEQDVDDAEEREAGEIDEAVNNMTTALAEFLEIAKAANTAGRLALGEAEIAEVETVSNELKSAADALVKAADRGETAAELFEIREDLEDIEGEFLASIEAVLALSEAELRRSREVVSSKIDRSVPILVLALLFALVVALTVSIRSSQQILRMMSDLSKARDELASLNGVMADEIKAKESARLELAQANSELQAQAEALRSAQEQLLRQEKMATLGQLTATVSHEIRNPLGAVRTSLYVIKQKAAQAELDVTRPLDRAERGIVRCDTIISELLDFARETEPELEMTLFDQWLASELAQYTPHSDIEIKLALDATDVQVALDGERLRRVIINLCDNASQAMEDNADDRPSVLGVETRLVGDKLELAISDTGEGMDEVVLAKVFEPLFSTKNYGVGLGLPTVKKIIESHGGAMEFESEVGSGTRVIVVFPVAVEIAAAASVEEIDA